MPLTKQTSRGRVVEDSVGDGGFIKRLAHVDWQKWGFFPIRSSSFAPFERVMLAKNTLTRSTFTSLYETSFYYRSRRIHWQFAGRSVVASWRNGCWLG